MRYRNEDDTLGLTAKQRSRLLPGKPNRTCPSCELPTPAHLSRCVQCGDVTKVAQGAFPFAHDAGIRP